MNLIYDIYFITSFCRTVGHFFTDLTNIIDAVVGCGVDLYYIHGGPCIDRLACLALVAGASVYRMFAVYRLCQDLGNGSLTCTTGAAEKIGMPNPVCLHLVLQCGYNVFLPLNVFKILGAELPIQSSIAHENSPFSVNPRSLCRFSLQI